jgi:hypothetical protein
MTKPIARDPIYLKAIKERSGIGPLDEPPDSTRANYRRGVQRITQALWNCEIPMIAAINGHGGSIATFVGTVTIIPFMPNGWAESAGGIGNLVDDEVHWCFPL